MATPIWTDIYVNLGTANLYAYEVYNSIDNTGTLLYRGLSYKKPGETNNIVRINDIVKDYLFQQMKEGYVSIHGWFSVYYYQGGRADFVSVFNCWDYTSDGSRAEYLANDPITGRIQVGTPLPITKMSLTGQEIIVNYSPAGTGSRVSLGTSYVGQNYLPTCGNYQSAQVFPRISNADHPEMGFNVTIIPKCHRWQLYYENALGGIDCLVIEGKSVQRDKYGRTVISKAYNNTATPIRNAGKVVVDTDVTRTWELHTGWLTDAEAGRMGHLLGSPLVYLYDCVSGVYYPVIIKTDEYQQKVTRYDGMIQYTINVELAETMKR